MAQENIHSLVAAIKEEINCSSCEEHTAVATEIKIENDHITPELISNENHLNPFENIQLQVKQEVNITVNISQENHTENPNTIDSTDTCMLEMVIKEEKPIDETLVSYDYPHFDDDSVDNSRANSTEATAFPNVEACMQEELNIKSEIEVDSSVDRKEIENEAKDAKTPSSEKQKENPKKGGRARKKKRGKTSHETRKKQLRGAGARYRAKKAEQLKECMRIINLVTAEDGKSDVVAKYISELNLRAAVEYVNAYREARLRSAAKYAAAHPEVGRRASAKYAASHPEVNRRSSTKYAAAQSELIRRAKTKYESNKADKLAFTYADDIIQPENYCAEVNQQDLSHRVGSYQMLEDYTASVPPLYEVDAEQYAAVPQAELEESYWDTPCVEYRIIENKVDPSVDRKEIEHEAKDVNTPSSEKQKGNPKKGGRPRKIKRGRPKTSHETRAKQQRDAAARYRAKKAEQLKESMRIKISVTPEDNYGDLVAKYYVSEVNQQAAAYATAYRDARRRSSAKYAKARPEVNRRAVAKYTATHPEVNRRAVAKYAASHPEVNRRAVAKYAASHPEVNRRSSAKYAAAHPEVNRRAAAKYRAKKKAEKLAHTYAVEINQPGNNSAEVNKQELPHHSYQMPEDYTVSVPPLHKVDAEQYAAVLKAELEESYWNVPCVEYSKIENKEHQKEELNNTEVKMEPDHVIHLTPITRTVSNTEEIVPVMLARRTRRRQVKTEASNKRENGMDSGEFQLNTVTGNEVSFEQQNYNNQLPSFQLNSITGNELSLEQEAYGLLKAKRKSKNTLGLFKCPECPKTYTKKTGLRAHLGVHRTIERRAMGVMRGMLKRKENQKKKINGDRYEYVSEDADANLKTNTKKEGYKCTCGQVFQRRSRMETCLRSHNLFESHTNCVSCMTCTKQFTNKDELALHRKRLHRKKFPCKFCPTDYDTRKELFKHLQIHQKVQLTEYKAISEVMNGKKKLRCFLCPKSWTELTELKIHVMNTHKGPYTCPHCKKTFPKIVDFGNHIKTYHPEVEGQCVLDVLEAFSKLIQSWKCEECELQFLEADKLALHQIEKHSPDLKAESQFQCADCRRVFISQKGLTSHRRIHHSTEATEEENKEITGIMCLECRKMCKDMTALTSHMRLHSPERKYPCKFCEFRFATQEKRKSHAEIHTGDMKYVCFICEYQCSSENRLKQHKLSLKHANMKEYLLTGKPLLEEESTSKEKIKKKEDNPKKRKKDKAQEKDKAKEKDCDASSGGEICCDVCGEKFENESKMLEHKQTHPFIEIFNDDKPSRIFFK